MCIGDQCQGHAVFQFGYLRQEATPGGFLALGEAESAQGSTNQDCESNEANTIHPPGQQAWPMAVPKP